MERNDRNNSENIRRGQGQQQTFRRNPQRPPSPDYSRQQRENASFERRMERHPGQEDGSRGNIRTSQEQRQRERGYDLPDRPQQRRDYRDTLTAQGTGNSRRSEQQEGRRDSGRFERQGAEGYTRENANHVRRNRTDKMQRSSHDDEYYNAPRASDPRRREIIHDSAEGGGIDMSSFDINYKGDSASSASVRTAGILGKPLILGGFAVAAALIAIIIFAVSNSGKDKQWHNLSADDSTQEYSTPDSITLGGKKIETDSDYIELAEMNISDINALSYCISVKSLFINNNQIADLTAIGDCYLLATLNAGSNQINDISALSHLDKLEDIDISDNQISDLSPLTNLMKLETLNASKNQISDVSPLANVSSLRQLILSDNAVSDIRPLADMTGLTTLELANNGITDISVLNGLSSLSTLNLSGNKISNVKPLKSLSSLTMLDLSGTPVSDVSALGSMKSLLELNLTGTNVSAEDLAALKKELPDCRISK